jgi:hypothetical protein
MSTPANFPDVGVPFADSNGRISMVWFQFLLQIFNRTGGASGSDDTAALEALIGALSDQFAGAPAPVAVLPVVEPDSFVPTHGIQDAPDLHATATQTANGFMSSADKVKLDAVSATVEDKFASGTGFTPGTTTALTLSKAYASTAAVMVHFDGAFQGSDQYTISGNTITFTSAIPVGTQTVYARG